jgi:hypothetical protein
MNNEILPRQIFGSKLGLVLGSGGKDTVRYTIIYKVKPVKEMMVRYGVCHKNCTKEYITKDNSIVVLKIDSGLFGLDKSGMVRQGESDKLKHPGNLKFDGFRGIEMTSTGKYRVWTPDFEKREWKCITPKGKEHTFYPFKDGLLTMPDEVLHDGDSILIPATEAVQWMCTWLEKVKGHKIVLDGVEAAATLGARAVTK